MSPRKTTPPGAWKFQITLRGFDSAGLDVIISASGNDKKEFTQAIADALEIHPLAGREAKLPASAKEKPAEHKTENSQAPAAESAKINCPKCGAECYDNRIRRGENDKRPLIKCSRCAWRVWIAPRTEEELADNALWKEEGK